MEEKDIVVVRPERIGYCAYCQTGDTCLARGMWCRSMSVYTCQDLIDIGWTRSGMHLYKPNLAQNCCPTYGYRLKVDQFIPSKDQRKAERRLHKYLQGKALNLNIKSIFVDKGGALSAKYKPTIKERKGSPIEEDETIVSLILAHLSKRLACQAYSLSRPPVFDFEIKAKKPNPRQRRFLPPNSSLTTSFCITMYHHLESKYGKNNNWTSEDDLAASIAQQFNEMKDKLFFTLPTDKRTQHAKGILNNLEAVPLNGHINFQSLILRRPLAKVELASPAGRYPSQNFRGEISKSRSLVTFWAPPSFDEEEYQLYKKYQTKIHGECPGQLSSFRYIRFLVDTPLIPVDPGEGVPEPGFGTFHRQYRIDGRLVAVSVVDILPRSLVSVYFFWDPDFAPLSLGKISALSEIEWVKAARSQTPDLEYYSLGYYVHSCPKTRYKAEYHPTELLCPESYKWVKLSDNIRHLLTKHNYVKLSAVEGAESEDNTVVLDLDSSTDSQSVVYLGKIVELGHLNKKIQRTLGELTANILVEEVSRWRMSVKSVANRLICDVSCLLDIFR